MAEKEKKAPPTFGILLVVVIALGLLWAMRDTIKGIDGVVTAKRESGSHVILEVRDPAGGISSTRIPKAQADEIGVGEKIHKDRFSRKITFDVVRETTITD
jgi:hypothetical protein